MRFKKKKVNNAWQLFFNFIPWSCDVCKDLIWLESTFRDLNRFAAFKQAVFTSHVCKRCFIKGALEGHK